MGRESSGIFRRYVRRFLSETASLFRAKRSVVARSRVADRRRDSKSHRKYRVEEKKERTPAFLPFVVFGN